MKKIVSKLISISLVVMMFISVVGCSTSTTEETEVDWDNINRNDIATFFDNTDNVENLGVILTEKQTMKDEDNYTNYYYTIRNGIRYYSGYYQLIEEVTEESPSIPGDKFYTVSIADSDEYQANDYLTVKSGTVSPGASERYDDDASIYDSNETYQIDKDIDASFIDKIIKVEEEGNNHIISFENKTEKNYDIEGKLVIDNNYTICKIEYTEKGNLTIPEKLFTAEYQYIYKNLGDKTLDYNNEKNELNDCVGNTQEKLAKYFEEKVSYIEDFN